MKLTFEPVTNRIGNDYFIVPKNDEDNIKVIIRCNDVAAFIIGLLVENHNRDEMIAATAAQYPNEPIEEVEMCVDAIREELKKHARKNESGDKPAEPETPTQPTSVEGGAEGGIIPIEE